MSEETRRVSRECLGGRVRMLSRVITGIYDEAFSDVGVKVSQFNVLVAVANREETRPGDLAKTLRMDESTLSRNVDRMCARGWLRQKPEAEGDRRGRLIILTEKGAALLARSYPAWEKAQAEVARRLGQDNVAALKSAARKLSA